MYALHQPLTTDQLVTAMDQLHGVGNAIKLEFLQMLDRLDRIEGWREDGATSLTNWVSYRYAMTWNTAFEHVRTMRALRDLPAIASAFAMGSISWEVLALLCTFVTPARDDEWSDRASRISAAEIRDHARKVRRLSREDAARNESRRYLWTSWSADGDFLRLSGLIPGAEGAMVKKTLDRIADQLGPGPDGIFANAERRRADALVELAGTHIAHDRDPDRANIVVHVEARQLAQPDGNAQIEDGPTIPAEVLRRLTCDARIEVVVHGAHGATITIGTVSRTVPSKMRRQLFERDKGCVNLSANGGLSRPPRQALGARRSDRARQSRSPVS